MVLNKKTLHKQVMEMLKDMTEKDIKDYLKKLDNPSQEDLQQIIDIGKTGVVLRFVTGYDELKIHKTLNYLFGTDVEMAINRDLHFYGVGMFYNDKYDHTFIENVKGGAYDVLLNGVGLDVQGNDH